MTIFDRALARVYNQPEPLPVPVQPHRSAERPACVETSQAAHDAGASQAWAWPAICDQLLDRTEAGFAQLAERLVVDVHSLRLKSVAFTSPDRCEGRTSTLLTLARALERFEQFSVLLIDADFGHPELQSLMSTPAGIGWWETLDGGPDIATRLPSLTRGRTTLLPLSAPVPAVEVLRCQDEIRDLFHRLRSRFELLLVDAGPSAATGMPRADQWLPNCVDSVITISSRRRRDWTHSFEVEHERWNKVGLEALGVIETFA